eukprot:gene20424-23198_t
MRKNPATSLFNVASQASSGIGSFVPSLGTRSTSPMNASSNMSHVSVVSEAINTSQYENEERLNDDQPTHSVHHDDDMAEALLAIALMESNSPQKNCDAQVYAECTVANQSDSDMTAISTKYVDIPEDASTKEHSSQDEHSSSCPEEPLCSMEETELATPVLEEIEPIYALPCATDNLIYLPATPEELQVMEDSMHPSSTPRVAEATANVRVAKKGQCDCVSSRIFPHRANKCTFRNLTGGAPAAESVTMPDSNTNSTSQQSDGVDSSRSLSPFRQHSNSEISTEQTTHTTSEENEAGMDASEENQTNAGSRPCRCVSAAMFPHRANKCKLFNTTNAGRAAVVAGAAQVSSVVAGTAGAGSRHSTSKNNADASPENKGKGQLTGTNVEEQHAVALKRRQDLLNIPNHRLFRSLLHMAGLNIAFIGAVSLVFLVTFGLCGHVVKFVFRALGNALLRR